jgi:transketolase N-terminal domain/subunit
MGVRVEGSKGTVLEEAEEKKLREKLEAISKEIRWDIVRMIGLAGSGHPGGSLSCVESLVCLYFYKMRHNPKKPEWLNRDRFVLSKGHAAPTLYAVLARCGSVPYCRDTRTARVPRGWRYPPAPWDRGSPPPAAWPWD